MKTITIATLKGGQSKTVTSACLAVELAMLNKKVLTISIDSQNDINLFLGATIGDKYLYNAIQDNDIKQCIYKTKIDNIDLVPYDISLSPNIDPLLQGMPGSEKRIKLLLKQISGQYDFTVLDTGPNLNISTLSAIVASDYMISPTTMRWASVNGFKATRNVLEDMAELEMAECKYLGIIRSMSNVTRNTETFEVENYLVENKYPEMGILPFSSAMITALYRKENFIDRMQKHHYEQYRKLFDNILNKVA